MEYEDLVRIEEEEEWNPLCSMEGDFLPDPQEIILSEIADLYPANGQLPQK